MIIQISLVASVALVRTVTVAIIKSPIYGEHVDCDVELFEYFMTDRLVLSTYFTFMLLEHRVIRLCPTAFSPECN